MSIKNGWEADLQKNCMSILEMSQLRLKKPYFIVINEE